VLYHISGNFLTAPRTSVLAATITKLLIYKPIISVKDTAYLYFSGVHSRNIVLRITPSQNTLLCRAELAQWMRLRAQCYRGMFLETGLRTSRRNSLIQSKQRSSTKENKYPTKFQSAQRSYKTLLPVLNGFLTLLLPTWRIWWAPNASKWQMGFKFGKIIGMNESTFIHSNSINWRKMAVAWFWPLRIM